MVTRGNGLRLRTPRLPVALAALALCALACSSTLAASLPPDAKRSLACPEDNFSAPAWSPDGKTIAYSAAFDVLRLSNDDIYVTSPDGSGPIRLTADPANDTAPANRARKGGTGSRSHSAVLR